MGNERVLGAGGVEPRGGDEGAGQEDERRVPATECQSIRGNKDISMIASRTIIVFYYFLSSTFKPDLYSKLSTFSLL